MRRGLDLSAVALAAAAVITLGAFTVGQATSPDRSDSTPGETTSRALPDASSTPVPPPTPADAQTPVTPSAPAPSAPVSPPEGPTAAQILRLLARVAVVDRRPNVGGYDRDCGPGAGCVFGPAWSDDSTAPLGRNGCDTRNDVLRQDLTDLVIDPDTNGCVVSSGTLHDPYTGRRIDFVRGPDSRAIEIDHLIPLAAAWDLGAWRWSAAQRRAFANDVTFELLAVDGPANQQKSDSTPASWLPPDRSYRCSYAVRYLRASIHWRLPVTGADVRVIRDLVRHCR